MARLLYLVHRMPYPPNKGDKVRSYHLLKHLAARHDVFVGSFVDDADDWRHEGTLRAMCTGLCLRPLAPLVARLRSLSALATGVPLTEPYYRDAALARWVRETARRERIDAVVVFSSSMAQYARELGLPWVVDFVDVDSAKWTQYADERSGPMAWVYRREGTLLAALERDIALAADRSFFATEQEAALFRRRAPAAAARVGAFRNGVDAGYFAPAAARPSPFGADEQPIVFTGAMDYWPNVDAVTWFARDVLPQLRKAHPGARLHVVGRSPTPAVRALASDAVAVTGTVPDVRPYLQHAAVAVAPLRLARGIQNKVLEAMAMGRPVVASAACAEPIAAERGGELVTAADAAAFVDAVGALLSDPARAAAVGAAGRRRVLSDHAWQAQLGAIDAWLPAADAAATAAEPALA